MKKIILMTVMLVCGMTAVFAQKPAQIKFDKTTHNFGTFSESNPVVSCSFGFTNVGEQPLRSIRLWLVADALCLNTRRRLFSQVKRVRLR